MEGKIGWEIECFATYDNAEIAKNLARTFNWKVGSDGSIRNYPDGHTSLEFKSRVISIAEIDIMLEETKKILALVKVNSTCGLHIHLSFAKMADYYKLMTWKFAQMFQNKFKEIFTSSNDTLRITEYYSYFYTSEEYFNKRISTQILDNYKSHERYNSINYNAFNLYKTIEFRAFAATDSFLKFKKTVNFLLNIVEEHISESNFQEIHKTFTKKVIKNPNAKTIIKEIITKQDLIGEN